MDLTYSLISSVPQAEAQSSKRNKRLIVVAVRGNYYILASYSKLCQFFKLKTKLVNPLSQSELKVKYMSPQPQLQYMEGGGMQGQFFTNISYPFSEVQIKATHDFVSEFNGVFKIILLLFLPSFNRYPLYRNLFPVCCASSFFFLALKCFLSSLTQVKFPKTDRNPLHAPKLVVECRGVATCMSVRTSVLENFKDQKKNRKTRLIISIVHLLKRLRGPVSFPSSL